MNGREFFDTNIFIYLYAENERDKQSICKEVINKAGECITSTQVLNEINNVLIRKWQLPAETVKTVQQDVRRISEVEYISEKRLTKQSILMKNMDFHITIV